MGLSVKENFVKFINWDSPEWIPSSFDELRFGPRFIPENIAKGRINDGQPFDIKNALGGKDWFGVEWVIPPGSMGAMVVPGNPKVPEMCDWEKYISFPNLKEIDWEGESKKCADFLNSDKIITMTMFTGYFERLMSLLDVEGALISMVDEDEQEGVHRFFDLLTDFYIDIVDRFHKYFGCELIFFHDDWGTQRAPFCAPETIDEMIIPYLTKLIDFVHSKGMYFELHCCGKNQDLVPLMIKAGVDMWDGQEMNDKEMLYEKYGKSIHLGVEPQGRGVIDPSLPMMSEEEQVEYINEIKKKYPEKDVYLGMFMGATPNIYRLLKEN